MFWKLFQKDKDQWVVSPEDDSISKLAAIEFTDKDEATHFQEIANKDKNTR